MKGKKKKRGVNQKVAAEHFGVSTETIRRWGHKQWLVRYADRSVDLEATAARVDAHKDPRGGKPDRNHTPQDPHPTDPTPAPGDEVSTPAPEDVDYLEARRRKEYWMAVRAELDTRRIAQELVPVEEAQATYTEMIHAAKANLESLPARMAHRLIGIQDAKTVQDILSDEIETALRGLSS